MTSTYISSFKIDQNGLLNNFGCLDQTSWSFLKNKFRIFFKMQGAWLTYPPWPARHTSLSRGVKFKPSNFQKRNKNCCTYGDEVLIRLHLGRLQNQMTRPCPVQRDRRIPILVGNYVVCVPEKKRKKLTPCCEIHNIKYLL